MVHLDRIGAVLCGLAVVGCGVGAARAEPAVVRAEAQTQTVACGGDAARIEGNRNTLVFTGACRSLDLLGDENRVSIALQGGARVRVEGQRNQVQFTTPVGGALPQISVAGVDSVVTPGGMAPVSSPAPAPVPAPVPQAASSAGPSVPERRAATPEVIPPARGNTTALSNGAMVRGDDQQKALDCAGGGAVIEGDRGSYVLRGRCKTLLVRGNIVVVQVELAPHATVTVEGRGTRLYWVQAGAGPAPQITLRGEGTRATKVTRLPS